MDRSRWHRGAEWWRGVAIAAIGFALFIAWLAAFEHYFEPWARRSLGALRGCPIGWTPSGPLRIWGSKEPGPPAREGALAVAGLVLVLLGAVPPVVALHLAALVIGAGHEALWDSAYLVSVPLMAIFVA